MLPMGPLARTRAPCAAFLIGEGQGMAACRRKAYALRVTELEDVAVFYGVSFGARFDRTYGSTRS